MSDTVPIILTPAGRTNTPPATLYAEVIAGATALAPAGLTILPAELVEDVAATDTGTLVLIDQAVTETIDSFSPFEANAYMLVELAQVYLGQGSTAASPSNTSVFVVFTSSAGAGTVIAPGFTVSDGTNQYTVAAPGGVTQTGGDSAPIFVQATQPGSWTVPPGSVTALVTSAPTGIVLTVTNPLPGTPGGPAETEGQFRARVLQAGVVASTGMTAYLRTLLQAVPGVQPQLVAIRNPNAGQWEVICGGNGDPYAIALAISQAIPDISTLVGSVLAVTGITNANPGVVTTNLNHGFAIGVVRGALINGVVGMTGINGIALTITPITEKTFSIGIDTTGAGTWTSGGVVLPNLRNILIGLSQYPDNYVIPFVTPLVQTVTATITWNTSSVSFVSPTGVAQLVQPGIVSYINSLPVGAPINELELNSAFIAAVAPLIPEELLTRLVYLVAINGVTTAPGSGTFTIFGDPEFYFSTTAPSITVIQG